MSREDRELLAELARINTAMASLALRIIEGSASVGCANSEKQVTSAVD